MKAEAIKSEIKFKPVVLTITLEGQDEVDQLFSIFNYSPVSDWFKAANVIFEALLPLTSKGESGFFNSFSEMFSK